MKVAIFQMDTLWHDSKGNCEKAEKWIDSLDKDVDLVILPEMFNSGFSLHAEEIAEEMDGYTVTWLKKCAKKSGKAIICSIAIHQEKRGKDHYYNRLFFISEDGVTITYDKKHLFSIADEHKKYTPGKSKTIIHYKGFRICPLVCYDLRFPVWSRNRNDYDLLIYVASWPESRSYQWSSLLKARAIENQCYTIGVNRVGRDPKLSYSGDSVILDYLGQPIVAAIPSKEEGIQANLNIEELNKFKEAFPAYLDKDEFEFI